MLLLQYPTVVTWNPVACSKRRSELLPYVLDTDGWRTHGLGMLQKYIDPAGDTRVHLWHPSLFQFGEEEATHDHRFDLFSEVLEGHLFHTECAVKLDSHGTHVIWQHGNQDAGGQDTPQPLPGLWCIEERLVEIPAGNIYTFPSRHFHRTAVQGLTITVITRGARSGHSHALFPIGTTARHATTLPQSDEVIRSVLSEAVQVLTQTKG